jgi:hypothetical protein
MNKFFQMGLQHGKLSHDFQPSRLPAPLELQKASSREQNDFWEGWSTGWDEQEVISNRIEATTFKGVYHV